MECEGAFLSYAQGYRVAVPKKINMTFLVIFFLQLKTVISMI